MYSSFYWDCGKDGIIVENVNNSKVCGQGCYY